MRHRLGERVNRTGRTHGFLVAVRPGAGRKWWYRCLVPGCGQEREYRACDVESGDRKTCGGHGREFAAKPAAEMWRRGVKKRWDEARKRMAYRASKEA